MRTLPTIPSIAAFPVFLGGSIHIRSVERIIHWLQNNEGYMKDL